MANKQTDLNTMINFWAHMLDESFNKNEIASLAHPSNKDEKFKVEDVFSAEANAKLDTDKALEDFLSSIWPEWEDYFRKGVEEVIEVEGAQKDVDDWDEWKISIADLNGGYENCKSMLFDDLFNDFTGVECSLKELLDMELEKLAETEYDLNTLENFGTCTYRGHYHTGGYYPDH